MTRLKDIVAISTFLLIGHFASSNAFSGAELDIQRDVAPLINGLSLDLNSLGRELETSLAELESLTVEVESCKEDECSQESSCEVLATWRQGVFRGLDHLQEEMATTMREATLQRTEAMEVVSREIEAQRSALESIESTLADIPSFDTTVNEFIETFQHDISVDHESLPVPSEQVSSRPANCLEAKAAGGVTGLTSIYPGDVRKLTRCDQDTDGGSWTVLLLRQRQEPQLNFKRSFQEYQHGFGEASGEYWIGLDAIRDLTSDDRNELLMTMTVGNETAASYYDRFSVDSSYKLHVAGYDGSKSTGGDSLTYHDNMGFTTYDRDRDGARGGNCADWCGGGGWWYNYCFFANPTGIHPAGEPHGDADHFLEWRKWQGYYAYLSDFVMMIRPKQR